MRQEFDHYLAYSKIETGEFGPQSTGIVRCAVPMTRCGSHAIPPLQTCICQEFSAATAGIQIEFAVYCLFLSACVLCVHPCLAPVC